MNTQRPDWLDQKPLRPEAQVGVGFFAFIILVNALFLIWIGIKLHAYLNTVP